MGDAFLIQNIKQQLILDGSSAELAASSVEDLINLANINTNDVYWLKGNSGEPYQTYVIVDQLFDGGGWELAYSIDAQDSRGSIGGIPHYNNNTFWTQANQQNQTSTTPWNTNVKTRSFDQRNINEVLIVLHNRQGFNQNNLRGWSVYSNNNQPNKSFLTIYNQGTNQFISSGGRKTSQNYVGNLSLNTRRPGNRGGDVFIDGTVNGFNNASSRLVINATGYWGSDGVNSTRLTTNIGQGNTTYGHTYAGIGIHHAHSGWSAYVAMAPITEYCEPPVVYGPDLIDRNNAVAPQGGSRPIPDCNNKGWANGFIACGYSVFVR